MKNPTFKEQYDKIVTAYLKNELNPMSCRACFVGNLLNNNNAWAGYGLNAEECIQKEVNGFYSVVDIRRLESEFMLTNKHVWYSPNGNILDENYLYDAMERTLLVLKQIHESKGEIVEDYQFTKRELQTA